MCHLQGGSKKYAANVCLYGCQILTGFQKFSVENATAY